jgi:hypothetical protein
MAKVHSSASENVVGTLEEHAVIRRGPLGLRRLATNSALLTDAFSSLRCACGAAKRRR